jgi:hypothetical protein
MTCSYKSSIKRHNYADANVFQHESSPYVDAYDQDCDLHILYKVLLIFKEI